MTEHKHVISSTLLFFICMFFPIAISSAGTLFDLPLKTVQRAPGKKRIIPLPAGTLIRDFDVSPYGPEIAVLTEVQNTQEIAVLDLDSGAKIETIPVPESFDPEEIGWHPYDRTLFLLGKIEDGFAIQRVDAQSDHDWSFKLIYQSQPEISRLLVGPRPFQVESIENTGTVTSYRLFFAETKEDGTHRILSVTEDGRIPYQVIGPKDTQTIPEDEFQLPPSDIAAGDAFPMAFHPAGDRLVWADANACFHSSVYGRQYWAGSKPIQNGGLCSGSLTVPPNGSGFIHWDGSKSGVDFYPQGESRPIGLATSEVFLSSPKLTPDGMGLVGPILDVPGISFLYIPVEMPLHDVSNAWMFIESNEDLDLFSENNGVLRELGYDQLYSLYESEAYHCGDYDEASPTRPYLVTTDIFWELFASAYEGLFTLSERRSAVPAFWDFVSKAHSELSIKAPTSQIVKAFAAVITLNESQPNNPETLRIMQSEGIHISSVSGEDFDFGALRPHGNYISDPEMGTYFRAFRYLTSISEDLKDSTLLSGLSPDVRDAGLRWIAAYSGFIAPSRAPIYWQTSAYQVPPYIKYPENKPVLFPLSWGVDNEILNSTVLHTEWPPEEQILDRNGTGRLLPSALDVAAVLGSALAHNLLTEQIEQYPNLGPVLEDLTKQALQQSQGNKEKTAQKDQSLYENWISVLGHQWAEETLPSIGPKTDLWRAKRLQTGLASWTTLRHATVLVNDLGVAECGEGGFEMLLMEPPRGYVEPDPETFKAIAGLFDAAADFVKSGDSFSQGSVPKYSWSKEDEPLRQGILKRLAETADKARLFADMAEKQMKGITLTPSE